MFNEVPKSQVPAATLRTGESRSDDGVVARGLDVVDETAVSFCDVNSCRVRFCHYEFVTKMYPKISSSLLCWDSDMNARLAGLGDR